MNNRTPILWTIVAVASMAASCTEPNEPSSPSERYQDGSTTGIGTTVEYSSDPVGVQGPTAIRSLLDTTKGDRVWMGYGEGDVYPTGRKRKFGSECEPDFGNKVYKVSKLPATIEGIVTLVPRHYQKSSLCAQDHRFYGSYYIQDATGSLLVLRDSRIADFEVGDRVRLKVRGLLKSFGTMKVAAFEEAGIQRDDRPAPYKTIDTSFADYFGPDCANLGDTPNIPDELGDSFRISGPVCQLPSTRNFGAFVVYPEGTSCSDDPETTWQASLGVELEPRVLDLKRGEHVTVTGPVTCSFDNYSMVVSSIGQFDQYRRAPRADR